MTKRDLAHDLRAIAGPYEERPMTNILTNIARCPHCGTDHTVVVPAEQAVKFEHLDGIVAQYDAFKYEMANIEKYRSLSSAHVYYSGHQGNYVAPDAVDALREILVNTAITRARAHLNGLELLGVDVAVGRDRLQVKSEEPNRVESK